jgi:thiol-disulfide isomerase/thioredoxin
MADPFLFLLREPAVHNELSLSGSQMAQLAELNEQFDGTLLASRNMPADQAREKVAAAISTSRQRIASLLDDRQRERFQQITYRARGVSFVLLPEASEQLKLSEQQQRAIAQIVRNSLVSIQDLQQQVFEGTMTPHDAEQNFAAARKDEQLKVLEQLDPEQRQRLVGMIGPAFDPAQLGRVTFRAPELSSTGTWINSQPLQLSSLRGKVVAVHFWAFGCINCIHNYPWYKQWHQDYADRGLVIIGIHTPETTAERDVERVREKVQQETFKFPIVIDNDNSNWNAWGNSVWPSVYLIDKQGRLRYWWHGELNWQQAGGQKLMAQRIEELLAETGIPANR